MHVGRVKLEEDRNLHLALLVEVVKTMTEKMNSRGIDWDPGYPKAAAFGGGVTAKFSGPESRKIESVD